MRSGHDEDQDLRTTQERLSDDKAIGRAMRMAVKAALLRHKRAGVPIVVWRSGKVVQIKAKDIKLSRDAALSAE